MQAGLLAKVVEYDRNFPARAGDRVRIALVEAPGDNESRHATALMRSALGDILTVAGLPHEEVVIDFTDALSLVNRCRAEHFAIVYIGPGLGASIGDIRHALAGVDVLTVAALPEYVQAGIVLGFGIEAGKPKLLFNLPQARTQNVAIRANLLALMEVYR